LSYGRLWAHLVIEDEVKGGARTLSRRMSGIEL